MGSSMASTANNHSRETNTRRQAQYADGGCSHEHLAAAGTASQPRQKFRPLTMHSAEWVRNGQISAVIRSQTDHRRCASLHTGTKGQQKLVLGTCAVGAAQWARRGRTSKITETAREARHVAMGKPESTGPVPQAEARGEHMSNHLGLLRHALSAPNCTRPQEAIWSPRPPHEASRALPVWAFVAGSMRPGHSQERGPQTTLAIRASIPVNWH